MKLEGKNVPKGRMFSSMVLYKKRLWTFGGIHGPGDLLADLNCFDIDSKTWTKVAADGAPEGRAGHGAVVDFAGTMWLWGGATGNGQAEPTYDPDVYSINLNEVDLTPKEGHYGAWQKVEVKGTPPSGRWMFSTVMNGTGMLIFGGKSDTVTQKTLSDVHYLDFEKKMWSEIKCQGDVPAARAGHGAAITSLGQMWVYGGHDKDRTTLEDLYYLKLEKGIWVKVAAKGVSPGPLMYHVQVMDAAGRMWLASGGKPGHDMHPGAMPFDLAQNGKVFYIDTSMYANAEWNEVEEFRGAAQRTAPSAAIETNGRMYCYGGVFETTDGGADPLSTIAWLDTNQPTPSTATTSAHPLDPASSGGGIGVGTILVILFVVAAIVAGGLFFLRRRREMRLLQEVQEPRQVELGPRA
eukprot:Skav205872  [mRNA]  locus=scaffold766:220235:221458:+ [translate_table: standard]